MSMKYFNFAALFLPSWQSKDSQLSCAKLVSRRRDCTAATRGAQCTRTACRVEELHLQRALVVSHLAEMHFEALDYWCWRRPRRCCVCVFIALIIGASLSLPRAMWALRRENKRRLRRSQLERKICSLDKLAFPLVLLRKINPSWLHSVLINRRA
jgi:hypothetical protein